MGKKRFKKRDSKKYTKSREIKETTKKRSNLSPYVGTKIRVSATLIAKKRVMDEMYIGDSFLFRDIKLEDGSIICDHVWIHADEINWNSFESAPNIIYGMTAIPYAYYHEFMNKPNAVKYSLGGVNIDSILQEQLC